MVMAGHTEDSADLQQALGYARVFFNVTVLMIILGMCSYFSNVIPGCIGAKRKDRIPTYFKRSMVLCTVLMTPMFILQFFADGIVRSTLGAPDHIALEVGVYCRLMVVTSLLLLLEIHLENAFVNLGYAKCATFNSFVTGMGVDLVCTYFFIYKYAMGMRGAALAQIVVKTSRVVIWFVLMWYYELGPTILGCRGVFSWCQDRRGLVGDRGRGKREPLLGVLTLNGNGGEARGAATRPAGRGREREREREPLCTRKEFRVFLSLVAPTICSFFSGWFIFELQLVCLAHIRGIPQAALAAGAVWVQSESVMSAVQNGWINVLGMRVLVLLGKEDPDAGKSFWIINALSFAVVAVTNVPLLLFPRAISRVISNDAEVRGYFEQLVWVLVLHMQTRILSINLSQLFIPMGKGVIKVAVNVCAFYLIASPIAGTIALTDKATHAVYPKMAVTVGATAIAQTIIATFSGCYFLRLNWLEAGRKIKERANSDKAKRAEEGGGQVVDGPAAMVPSCPVDGP